MKNIDLNAVSYSFGDSPVSVPNSAVDDVVSAQLGFAFAPKEDITNVAGIKLSNIELTYSNGTVDKIAEGRLGKFYKETVLMEQEYHRDAKLSVAQYLDSEVKGLKVTSFKRVNLNED